MLRSLKDLEQYVVQAIDGDIGNVVDVLLEDDRWIVRYLVVQTGGPLFLDGRRVLISPISFREVEWSTHRFHLAVTREKVKNSPSVDLDEPVSRQHERDYSRYFGYPYYWGYAGAWGMGAYPSMLAVTRLDEASAERFDEPPGDVHLRSAKELRRYHIHGSDHDIGHVDDFIVNDETWEIRYLVIDTRNWWFGKKVLVAPHWASRVSWEQGKVYVDLSRKMIQSSPEWNPADGINREYETRLYDYYGRPAYWSGEPPSQANEASRDLGNGVERGT